MLCAALRSGTCRRLPRQSIERSVSPATSRARNPQVASNSMIAKLRLPVGVRRSMA